MRQLVELNHILRHKLLLKVQIRDVFWRSHSHPVILLLDHVIDPFDSHEEPEHSIVVDKRLFIKNDLKWPISPEIDHQIVQTICRIDVIELRVFSKLDGKFVLKVSRGEVTLGNPLDALMEVPIEKH